MARVNEKMEIGLVGLAVMGQNLVLNLVDHGYRVAVHNRTTATTHRFLAERAADRPVKGAETLEDLVGMLEPPRRILLMVKAGAPVDSFIERLLPLLSAGDVLADLGNSFYLDTARRLSTTAAEGSTTWVWECREERRAPGAARRSWWEAARRPGTS